MSEERRAEVNDVLGIYCGTHNFYNFTSAKQANDASCKRYIMNCTCEAPFMVEGIEFVQILIRGQSFVLHQIRKMIGLCIAIVRGLATKSTIQRAWQPHRLDIPKAPGLGLVLKEVHFDWYNKRYAATHAPIQWTGCTEALKLFYEERILPIILNGEKKERSMFLWLSTLPIHTFEIRGNRDDDVVKAKETKTLEKQEEVKTCEELVE